MQPKFEVVIDMDWSDQFADVVRTSFKDHIVLLVELLVFKGFRPVEIQVAWLHLIEKSLDDHPGLSVVT